MKTETEGPFVYKSKIISKNHVDSKTEFTYHYGYSFYKGKFCYRYGPETIPEENWVSYLFLGELKQENNNSLMEYDSIYIYYHDIYQITKNSEKILYNYRIDSMVGK